MAQLRKTPFPAYKDFKLEEHFIFVSYAHRDAEEVYEDIAYLDKLGFRIWYDEGIELAQNFPAEIEKALKRCSFFLMFLSPESMQ